MLLLQGGALDPNIQRFLRALQRRGVPHHASLIGDGATPRMRWHLGSGRLEIDGAVVRPSALFLRYNVFMGSGHVPDNQSSNDSFRAQAWYAAWHGWVAAHPAVALLNRTYGQQTTNKPEHLIRARRFGLAIPDTWVTNDIATADLAVAEQRIAKPVAGGGYTHTLSEALAGFPIVSATLPAPALVQQRLSPPEVRVFVVGDQTFAFEVSSSALDYREGADTTVRTVPTPPEVVAPLKALAGSLGLDYAAADFKTDEASGALTFLEINSQPMFARFDQAAGGSLVDAMIDWLTARAISPQSLH